MSFTRIGILSAVSLVSLIGVIYLTQIKERVTDRADYEELVRQSKELTTQKSIKTHPITQTRSGVRKEIWTPSGNERSLFQIESEDSLLTIKEKNGSTILVENLRNLTGWIEEIDPVSQKKEIRTLKSAQGIYQFPEHQFQADEVLLKFFRLPEFDLKQSPYLQGTVTEVTFGAKDKNIHFTAEHMEVNLDHKQVRKEGL
jgi:hypothetical protein